METVDLKMASLKCAEASLKLQQLKLLSQRQQIDLENLQYLRQIVVDGKLNNSLVQFLKIGGDFEAFIGAELPTINKDNHEQVSTELLEIIDDKLGIDSSTESVVAALAATLVPVTILAGLFGMIYASIKYTLIILHKAMTYVRNTVRQIKPSDLDQNIFSNHPIPGDIKQAIKAIPQTWWNKVVGWWSGYDRDINHAMAEDLLWKTEQVVEETVPYTQSKVDIVYDDGLKVNPSISFGSISRISYGPFGGDVIHTYGVLESHKGIYTQKAANTLLDIINDNTKLINKFIIDPRTVNLIEVKKRLESLGVTVQHGQYAMKRINTLVSEVGVPFKHAGWSAVNAYQFISKFAAKEPQFKQYLEYEKILAKAERRKFLIFVEPIIDENLLNTIDVLFNIQWMIIRGLCLTSVVLSTALLGSRKY